MFLEGKRRYFMGDVWIREMISTLIAAVSALTVISVQFLLCFKAKKLFLRLLPSLVLTATTVYFFLMMRIATDWDAIGYAILGVFSAVLLVFSGIAWVVWAIAKLIRKKKHRRNDL